MAQENPYSSSVALGSAHIGSTVHTLLGKSVELMVWSVCRGVGKIIMLLVFVGMITMIVVANFQL